MTGPIQGQSPVLEMATVTIWDWDPNRVVPVYVHCKYFLYYNIVLGKSPDRDPNLHSSPCM